jgi:putative transposase
MARTFTNSMLFGDDDDRHFFLTCLSRRIQETEFLCYAWVLMDTHYHLLIRTNDLPLWHLMRPIQGDYAIYYNKKYQRRGPLFSERFKSIATQDQYYLEQLIRYIHLNPIRAGICKTLAQLDRYPWSGHRMIMKNDRGGFQEIIQILRRFGKNNEEARNRYREFIGEGIATELDADLLLKLRENNSGKRERNSPGCWVIGDAAFQKSVLEKDIQNRLTLTQHIKNGISLNDVLMVTARQMRVDENLILEKSKRTPQAKARMVFCFFAKRLGFSTMETGNFLGIQQAAVSNAARKGAVIAKQENISWKHE